MLKHFCPQCWDKTHTVQRHPLSCCNFENLPKNLVEKMGYSGPYITNDVQYPEVIGNSNALRFVRYINGRYNKSKTKLCEDYCVKGAHLLKSVNGKPSIQTLIDKCLEETKSEMLLIFCPYLLDVVEDPYQNLEEFQERIRKWCVDLLVKANASKKTVFLVNSAIVETDISKTKDEFLKKIYEKNNKNLERINYVLRNVNEKIFWRGKVNQRFDFIKILDDKISETDGTDWTVRAYDNKNGVHLTETGFSQIYWKVKLFIGEV
jgi:hypothetical protein